MWYLIWAGLVAYAVAAGPLWLAAGAIALALVFIAGRTRLVPRLRRHLAKKARERRAQQLGLEGELKVKGRLEERGLIVLHDVYLPHPVTPGALTQIDLIALGWNGIHVLEVKAHAATVEVDPLAMEWTATYATGFEVGFYNPMMQNELHLDAVKSFLGDDLPVLGSVVFPGATLKYLDPAPGGFSEVPGELMAGVPHEAVTVAWRRLEEHDRSTDKIRMREVHLAAQKRGASGVPLRPELDEAKRIARRIWITGCQAELRTAAKIADVKRAVRAVRADISDDEEAVLLRYAQAHVTRREISAQRAVRGELVDARRRAAGTNWLPKAEFRRAVELEYQYGGGGGRSGWKRRYSPGKITPGEIWHIVGVCVGLLTRH